MRHARIALTCGFLLSIVLAGVTEDSGTVSAHRYNEYRRYEGVPVTLTARALGRETRTCSVSTSGEALGEGLRVASEGLSNLAFSSRSSTFVKSFTWGWGGRGAAPQPAK